MEPAAHRLQPSRPGQRRARPPPGVAAEPARRVTGQVRAIACDYAATGIPSPASNSPSPTARSGVPAGLTGRLRQVTLAAPANRRQVHVDSTAISTRRARQAIISEADYRLRRRAARRAPVGPGLSRPIGQPRLRPRPGPYRAVSVAASAQRGAVRARETGARRKLGDDAGNSCRATRPSATASTAPNN